MIIDKIENIYKYNIVSENVKNFLMSLTEETPVGRHEIDENAYANVDEYTTHDNCRLEAHKKYIDIQILLKGRERLDYISTENLEISEQYDDSRDVMFFQTPNKKFDTVILESNKFAFIFPHEAHMPQMKVLEPQKVKKVVIKVLV